ncbi:MAG TPA: histidine phosphatase family protein, partial [Dissulfurispiraceae bacterium]|nr:histidine phosphatase family protein [Dissulfurispiraceae bacterium]
GQEEKRYKGSIDVPISGTGLAQIKRTGEFIRAALGGPSLAAVYSSPLSRALRSAEILAAPFGLQPIVVSELRERHFGVWEGMTLSEISEKYPDEFRAWAANPLEHSPMGGESTLQVRDRLMPVYEEIVSRHPGENIVIAGHGGVNRIVLCHVLGMPLEHIFRIEQDNAAVNIIAFYDKFPVVRLLNGGTVG